MLKMKLNFIVTTVGASCQTLVTIHYLLLIKIVLVFFEAETKVKDFSRPVQALPLVAFLIGCVILEMYSVHQKSRSLIRSV